MDEIFEPTKPTKDFFERLLEIVKDDKELHDAFVRLVHATAEGMEIRNAEKKKKLQK